MRLMRYYRDGLLAIKRRCKKRRCKGFKYQITVRGEKRLLYLWKKHGSYEVDKKLSQKEATVKKKMVELCIKKAIYLLEKHKSLIQKEISNI
jgi:hypothetical protein